MSMIGSLMAALRKSGASLLHSEHGAMTPAFAILLPVILSLMTFGIDGGNVLAQKARLAVALEEGTLAISTAGNSAMAPADEKVSKQLIERYLQYYLPGIKGEPMIVIAETTDHTDSNGFDYTGYNVGASVKIPFFFNTGSMPGLGHEIEIGNYQTAVKKYISVPGDYVFVVDFSTSQAGARLKTLKAVVKEVAEFSLASHKDTRIAIVPFSVGVPVKLPGVNERGGERVGCSVLFVPTSDYAINYAFWADKYIDNQKNFNAQMYKIDNARYEFYNSYVRNSSPKMTAKEVTDTWCVANANSGSNVGHAKYSCKTPGDDYSDIFSERSQMIVAREYLKAYNVKQKHNIVKNRSLVHDQSINYEATLENMFSDAAVITFPMSWTKISDDVHRPFNHMCRNGGWNEHVKNNDLRHSSARSWLIELTNDIGKVNEFQNMIQQGETQMSSGLLRSVPVMMKGKNKRKVFILISDGEDNASKDVTEKLLKQYDLCGKIESGIKSRSEIAGTRVELYYISTTNNDTRVAFWANNCTGSERAKTVSKKEDLVKTLKGIMTDETGHFSH